MKAININLGLKIFEFQEDIISLDDSKSFSKIFYNSFFGKKGIQEFLDTYYIYKKHGTRQELLGILQEEINFIVSKQTKIYNNIDFRGKHIPSGEDIFMFYRMMSTLSKYFNDYFSDDEIGFKLQSGLIFHRRGDNFSDLLRVIKFYKNTKFFLKFINPMIIELINANKNEYIYTIEVYSQQDFIFALLISDIIKQSSSKLMVHLDFSKGNEQIDFTQWIDNIQNNKSELKKYFDFASFYNSYDNIENRINNIIQNHLESQNFILDDSKKNISFKDSIREIYNVGNIQLFQGNNYLLSRFSPYKCYWNKCNFCNINSQNLDGIDDTYDYQYFLNKWIGFIKKYNIKYLVFIDEAIPPLVIFKFSQEILKQNIKIEYTFRTRFEKFYTTENLKIIQKSGARFLGMGLESADDEINQKIGNKGSADLIIKQKLQKNIVMDSIGISIHNYSIMGFPGETIKQSIKTYAFLKYLIENTRQFTCSPNIFSLIRGTQIYNNLSDYNIEILNKHKENEFNLSYDFIDKTKVNDKNLLVKLVSDLHRLQFTPWISKEVDVIDFTDFWYFIDKSNIFYLMKIIYRDSPYYEFKNINSQVLGKSLDEIKNKYFTIGDYFQEITNYESNNILLYNWSTCKHVTISENTYKLIKNYNKNYNLKINLDNIYSVYPDHIIHDINLLFDAKILKYSK